MANDLQALLDAKNDPATQQDQQLVDPNASSPDDLAIGMPQGQTPSPSAPAAQQAAPQQDPRLAAALASQGKQQDYANLLRSFQQMITAGATGSGYKPDTSLVDNLDKQAGQPVEAYKLQNAKDLQDKQQKREDETHQATMDEFQEKLAASKLNFQDMQANQDPSSPQSKLAQDFYLQMAKEAKQPVNEDTIRSTPGATLYKYSPEMQKVLHDHFQQQNEQLHRQTQVDINDQNNQTRQDVANANAQARADMLSDKADQKKEDKITKLTKDFKEDLDPNKARGGNLAKSQAVVNSAERVNALFTQFPDGNIPASQTAEVAGAVAGLINNGSAQSQHQINTLTPQSMVGDTTKITSWLLNKPLGSEQQAFMKMLQDTSNREKGVAQDQVNKAMARRVSAHKELQDLAPDVFNRELKSAGFDPNEFDEELQYNPKTATSTGPLGDTTVKDGKTYKWNASVGKYQLFGP